MQPMGQPMMGAGFQQPMVSFPCYLNLPEISCFANFYVFNTNGLFLVNTEV